MRGLCLIAALLCGEPAVAQQRTSEFGGATPILPQNWFTHEDLKSYAKKSMPVMPIAFEFAINPEGKAESCTVTRSSGDASLDAKTCEIFLQRARFKMPKDGSGRPVATKGHSQVIWRM